MTTLKISRLGAGTDRWHPRNPNSAAGRQSAVPPDHPSGDHLYPAPLSPALPNPQRRGSARPPERNRPPPCGYGRAGRHEVKQETDVALAFHRRILEYLARRRRDPPQRRRLLAVAGIEVPERRR